MIHKLTSISNDERTTLKPSINLRLFACLCAVLMPILQPSDALAQRKLVPFKCDDTLGLRCSGNIHIDEDAYPEPCRTYLILMGNDLAARESMLYADTDIGLRVRGTLEHEEEFTALVGHGGVIDSSNSYLLGQDVADFLELFRQTWGFESVVASGVEPSTRENYPIFFSVFINNPGMYNIWSVRKLFAEAKGVDTSNAWAVFEAGDLGLPFCAIVVSSVTESLAPISVVEATPGEIRLVSMQGPFSIIDINARMVTQGFMQQGDAPRTIGVPPGVYVVVTSTSSKLVLVMP